MDFLFHFPHIAVLTLMLSSFVSISSGQLLTFGLTAGLEGNQVQQPYGLVGNYPLQVEQAAYMNPQMVVPSGCISCASAPMMQMNYPAYYGAMSPPVQPYMAMPSYGVPYGPRMERPDGPIKKFWKGAAEGLMMTGLGGVFGRR